MTGSGVTDAVGGRAVGQPGFVTTGQYIAWHARDAPEAIAIVEGEERVTYRDLAADLGCCVAAVCRLGVAPGMLVGLQVQSARYFHLLLILACEIAGATTTSVTPEEVARREHLIQHCDMIVADSASDGAAKVVTLSAADVPRIVTARGRDEAAIALARAIAPGQIARIVRTSGTTGRPKAMPIMHATLQLRVTRMTGLLDASIRRRPRFLCLYGLAAGLIHVRVLSVLRCGGCVLFAGGEHVRELLAAGAFNYAAFALGDVEKTIADSDLAGDGAAAKLARQIDVFGATLPAALRRRIEQRLNATVLNKYSMNETNVVAIMGDGDAGWLCDGVDVRIVDPAGRVLPTGEAGLIRVRSETTVRGYFNDKAATDAAFIDGWFQTSDMGVVPAPRRLVVLGRADDMLNVGGLKIAPGPIEGRLRLLPDVLDAVVMSVENANKVGMLLAAVELGDSPLREGLAQHIGAELARHVSRFHIMPMRCFPRTITGKVRRYAIATEFQQRPAHQGIAVV
jgi:acyl-CoA synthetase (AMP-forming)/AMP-acid ligase II